MRFLLLLLLLPFFSIQAEESSLPQIDVVYLWVDGSDPVWLAERERYAEDNAQKTTDANVNSRFADHDELKYSLRSLHAFAPFVNHIYIITMNQKPKWLLDHPKITIVDHTEIFPDLSVLPTFNSHALECNLHRIPNLSEFFIYFNDDVFLGQLTTPADFFTEEGHIKVLYEKGLSPTGPRKLTESAYRTAWRNTNSLLDLCYKKERRYRLCHAPFSLRKSFIEEVEILFPDVFTTNSLHRFRTCSDYNVTNGLFQNIWKYQGKAEAGDMTNRMVTLYGDEVLDKTAVEFEEIQEVRYHTFCFEDYMSEDAPKTMEAFHEFLESYFPEPGPWEATDALNERSL